MSIYIKDMEMPKGGYRTVEIAFDADGHPMALCDGGDVFDVIPVPPHGRLVDADVLKKIVASSEHMDAGIFDGKMLYSDHLCVGADYEDVCKAIDETPTVIPANKETSHE